MLQITIQDSDEEIMQKSNFFLDKDLIIENHLINPLKQDCQQLILNLL